MNTLRVSTLILFSGTLLALLPLQTSAQTTTAPAIVTQPMSVSVAAGASASFAVTATGTAPLTYQWSKGGVAIASASSATLMLNAVTTADAGNYTVTVSNSAGSVTSATAMLTVTPSPSTAPVISTQPMTQSVAAGASEVVEQIHEMTFELALLTTQSEMVAVFAHELAQDGDSGSAPAASTI